MVLVAGLVYRDSVAFRVSQVLVVFPVRALVGSVVGLVFLVLAVSLGQASRDFQVGQV